MVKTSKAEMPNNHDEQNINVKIRLENEDYKYHACICGP